jgi:hypothetical protein
MTRIGVQHLLPLVADRALIGMIAERCTCRRQMSAFGFCSRKAAAIISANSGQLTFAELNGGGPARCCWQNLDPERGFTAQLGGWPEEAAGTRSER